MDEDDKRDLELRVRMNQEEMDQANILAKARGMSKGALVRMLLHQYAVDLWHEAGS